MMVLPVVFVYQALAKHYFVPSVENAKCPPELAARVGISVHRRRCNKALAQGCDGCIVVWLGGDLRDYLGVGHLSGLIQDDDRARQQASQWTVDLGHAVVRTEVRAEDRSSGDVLDVFGTAEAAQCEWQVSGNAHYGGVLQAGSQFVETANAGSADTGINRWEDVQG